MSNKDLSIIIVDDLQFSRIVVKTALKKAGYKEQEDRFKEYVATYVKKYLLPGNLNLTEVSG